jgi:RNA polymerase sigma-70 factor (ECF subfamily)
LSRDTRPEGNDLSDAMVAYQRGELSAFDELYRHLAPKLRGYLTALTWNPARSEDLLQETFLQMHRSRRSYIPKRPVAPWAFAIARHVYLMDRRASSRRRKFEVGPIDNLPEIPVPAGMEGLAARSVLLKALGELSDERREAVLLHHVWGFSFGEIGAMLGIREGAAKVRAHRALRALRERLAQQELT